MYHSPPGGAAWVTGSYDPQLDLVYWSTGNAAPAFDGRKRSGANLFTDSVLALDPDDGTIRWHSQFTPHDVWDYDGVNENILFEQDGRPLLAHFDRNGYLYVLDRRSGERISVTQVRRTRRLGRMDASGRPTNLRTPTPEGAYICPGPAGAKEWTHAAFSQKTGLLYAPVIDMCATFKLKETVFEEGMSYWGGDVLIKPQDSHTGLVKAIDPKTGRVVWSTRFPTAQWPPGDRQRAR